MHRKATLAIYASILLLLLGFALLVIGPYLLALLMGGILSLLLAPLCSALQRGPWRLRRRWAALGAVLLALLLVIGPLSGFGLVAVRQGLSLGQRLAQDAELAPARLISRLSHWSPLMHLLGDPQAAEAQLRSALQAGARGLTGVILALMAAVPGGLIQVALAMIACFFMLVDGGRFRHWLGARIPLDREVRGRLFEAFQETALSVIWATLATASAQAALMGVLFMVLDVPLALLAAGATFLFAWIPVLGSTPVWLAGAIYLHSQSRSWAMLGMALAGLLVVGLVDNLIRPWVLRGRGGMHPLVSLVAIFGGIQFFGLFGIFFGPILASLLLALMEVWPSVGRRFGLLDSDETAS